MPWGADEGGNALRGGRRRGGCPKVTSLTGDLQLYLESEPRPTTYLSVAEPTEVILISYGASSGNGRPVQNYK